MDSYLAVIADLIDSRSIPDRARAQRQIRAALKAINQRHGQHIASAFTLTLGDEFQALLYVDAPVFHILDEVERAITPYAPRFGIGLGTMATPINPHQSVGADGPAFWHAREAVQYVHDNDDYGLTRTRLKGCGEALDDVINSALALSDAQKRGWSAVQVQTFHALLESGIYEDNFDQKKLAQELGISQTALSKRLKLSGIKSYLRCRRALQRLPREVVHG